MLRKSKSDDRAYRYLKLQNDLQCLLVSDKDVEKSAACLYVNVGSLHDPTHINGLAHFLEHMLFLGTRKYPEENHYSSFIQKNGGSKNAATSEEYTYYYFDIKNECFEEAIDIFSQFFKEPLFTENSTEREMKAVDSEYKKNLSDEGRRLFQFVKSVVAKEGSPLSRFSTGSLETLNIPTIREDLLQFHQKYYSSNIMNLVLVGKESIDKLQQMAIDNFKDVENKHTAMRDFSLDEHGNPAVVFDERSLGHFYRLVPNKNLKKLSIQWLLPFSEDLWRNKPNVYITHVLGHEGPNSLLSHLIKEGLATSLNSSISHRLSCMDILTMNVGLTDLGERDHIKVLKLIYSFINKIKHEGVKDYIYDEIKVKRTIDFEYLPKSRALHLAQNLAGRMFRYHDHEIDDILIAPYLYEHCDHEEIMKRLSLLVPSNSHTIFISKTNERFCNEATHQVGIEHWYNTKYVIEKLHDDLQMELEEIMPVDQAPLSHPPRNNFIPRNLIQKKVERQEQDKPSFPEKILEDPVVWYK